MAALAEGAVSGRVRVLHVIQNLNYGGMERLFADIVRLLDGSRFESHVLVLGYLGRFGEGLERHATIHHAVAMRRGAILWPRALAAQIRGIAPDVVHSHAGVWYKVARAARMAGVPWIVHTEHGRKRPDPWLDRRIGRLAAGRTDRIAAVSEVLRAQLERTVVPDPSRLRLVANGVDTGLYQPAPDNGVLRAELGLGGGTPIVGSIGRLEQIKGYDIVVEAYALLMARWPAPGGPVLVLVGDGAERARLEALIAQRRLAGRAFILGWRDDLANLHPAFTLFTMGSRSEGTSVSLLEAMSAGLCPVVTDVGGNAAVLGPGLGHRLVPPLDPAALAGAWDAALTDPARRAADGAAARARVQAAFSLEAMVRNYETLYLEGPAPR